MTYRDPHSAATTDERAADGCPTRPSFSTRQTFAAVAIAAIIAAVGGAAIYAATSVGSHNVGAGMHGTGLGGRGGPGGSGPPASLHGEFVVSDRTGGHSTELTQTGIVTAVSDGSFTARSADGFTATYVIAPGTPAANSEPAVNDTVTIRGALENGAPTATDVTP
ncbi:MAG: hypothetical protein JWR32_4730 [Mycobacterium sp.]|jgi:hypothetical protein|nr:hypothetical protein [Mycobacterium sp.]